MVPATCCASIPYRHTSVPSPSAPFPTQLLATGSEGLWRALTLGPLDPHVRLKGRSSIPALLSAYLLQLWLFGELTSRRRILLSFLQLSNKNEYLLLPGIKFWYDRFSHHFSQWQPIWALFSDPAAPLLI